MAYLLSPKYNIFDFPTIIQRIGVSANDAVRPAPSLDPFQAFHLLRNVPRLTWVFRG